MRRSIGRFAAYVLIIYVVNGVLTALYFLAGANEMALFIAAMWIPIVAVIIVLAATGRAKMIGSLFLRFFRFGFPARNLGLVAVYLVIVALSLATYALFVTDYRVPERINWTLLLSSLPLTMFGAAIAEEYGWRGFALDELCESFSPFISSVIIGVFWTIAHIPLWLTPSLGYAGIPFGSFAVALVAQSISYTFLVRASGGSLFPAWLTHFLMNETLALVPLLGMSASPFFYYYATGQLIYAAIILVATRGTLVGVRTAPKAA